MRILVIDDDKLLSEYLRLALREDGHAVDVAVTGEKGALMALDYDYDAVVLDYLLPGSSGVDVILKLRHAGCATPVIMLTARDAKTDVIEALDAGVDDYLVKPFEINELRARIRALARRGGATRTEQVRLGDLVLDRLKHCISSASEPLSLTPKEYALLEYFLLNAQRVVTRSELLEKVWDLQFDPVSNIVDVHVSRVREKLKQAGSEATIATIRGSGFILQP